MNKIFRILILFLILTLSLSGCGLFNLSNWVLPDDVEFLALIQDLDTPRKISDYMIENFEYEAHPFNDLTPYQLYITKKGDCSDTSTFAVFIANYHGYETYQIHIYRKNSSEFHSIAVYRENEQLSYSSNFIYYPVEHNTFLDIVKAYSKTLYIWSKYIVYDYEMNIIEQGTK